MHRLVDGNVGEAGVDMVALRLLLVHRICDEFNCTPTQAARELDQDPEHLAFELLGVRQYLRCKAAYDRPGKDGERALEEWQGTDTLETVKRHGLEIHQEDERARRSKAAQQKG